MTNAPRPPLLLAYSGGLDTSFLVLWLTHERGYDVTTLSVDCGGFDADERARLEARALSLGAVAHRTVDARADLFQRVLRWLLAGNVRRGGTYPLCVAAERGLQAETLAREAQAGGFRTVAHGCTGAGNDQIRFEGALAVVGRGLEVLAPIRDEGFERRDELARLGAAGFPPPPQGGTYSINAGLWGVTLGGGAMSTSAAPLPDDAWYWTADADLTSSRVVEVGFERGVPTALDGEALAPVALIERLNALAAGYGVGRGYHLGDTLLGIKGRIAYEAPAAEVLLAAHRELEKLVLTEDQRFWKDQLGDVYGKKLHQGLLHDPLLRDLEALFEHAQGRVTGSVRVRLRAGQALVEGMTSPHSLLAASDAVYGERPAAGSDPAGPRWLARVLSEPSRLAHRAAGSSEVLA